MENRELQAEVLQELITLNEGVVKNMKIIEKEFGGQRLDDTDAFLNGIIEGLNWEIQAVNGTLNLLNEKEENVSKSEFESSVQKLNEAVQHRNDEELQKAVQNFIPVLENLGEAAKRAIM